MLFAVGAGEDDGGDLCSAFTVAELQGMGAGAQRVDLRALFDAIGFVAIVDFEPMPLACPVDVGQRERAMVDRSVETVGFAGCGEGVSRDFRSHPLR